MAPTSSAVILPSAQHEAANQEAQALAVVGVLEAVEQREHAAVHRQVFERQRVELLHHVVAGGRYARRAAVHGDRQVYDTSKASIM